MVKTNLIENKNSANVARQLGLEIKHAALLLLLGRAQDAEAALESAINVHPKNFDLRILEAAAYSLMDQTHKAKDSFKAAGERYLLKL